MRRGGTLVVVALLTAGLLEPGVAVAPSRVAAARAPNPGPANPTPAIPIGALGAPIAVAHLPTFGFPGPLPVQLYDQNGSRLDQLNIDFTEADAIAIGDVLGADGTDEILVAGDVTGIIEIFDLSGLPRGSFNAGFTANDGLAVGNLDGFVGDEIVIAGDETGTIDIFSGTGQQLSSFNGNFTSGDGFAVGDVNGDTIDEVVIAGDVTGIVDMFDFSGQPVVPSFNGNFTENDGLAVGDVDGDGVDEILIGGDVGHMIDIFAANGSPKLPSFNGDFTEDDFIAAGDVNADGLDEIVILGDETQTVDIFSGGGVPLGSFPAITEPFQPFASVAGFAIGRDGYPDQDRDGLLEPWETAGSVDVNGDGSPDVFIPGANPLHKDLFLEFDWDVGDQPTRAAVQGVKAAFAAAPIDAGGFPNPDGLPGINLWIDTGGLTQNGVLVGDNLGGGNQLVTNACGIDDSAFYDAKNAPNFDPNRRNIFRYAISGNAAAGCGTGGQGEIGGNDFIEYNHNGGTIMHELGHNLGLRHGGHSDHNCKPNYVSVMNYDFQRGIPQVGGGSIIDYSPPRLAGGGRANAPLATIEEDALIESNSFSWGGSDTSNMVIFVDGNGNKVRSPVSSPPDWNGNGVIDEGSVFTVNVDTVGPNGAPAACANSDTDTVIHGSNDWSHVSVPFRQFGDSANSALNPGDHFEPTLADEATELLQLNTTDLAITITDDPEPAIAGSTLTYTLTVVNNGPNPADEVQVVQTLPSGVTFQSSDQNCIQAPAGTLTCDLGFLLAHASQVLSVVVLVAADLVYNAGGPTTITTTATVDNLAGPDPTGGNDSDTEQTLVVAQADLDIVGFSAVGAPLFLVGQNVSLTLDKVITNHGPSAPMDVRLTKTAAASLGVSITPTSSSATESALGLDEQRTVTETFTVRCLEPSHHQLSFGNHIAPAHPADSDPNPANDDATLVLDIECVLPVAINIKPGGYPNSINIDETSIPVAVLTTSAGEYGTPLDFSASSIDPQTVRFGARDTVLSGGGASEIHGTGHLERSYELNEKTRDADLDMVLHFNAAQTGLEPGDTEACIAGQWTDAAQQHHEFFGCDTVNIVPK